MTIDAKHSVDRTWFQLEFFSVAFDNRYVFPTRMRHPLARTNQHVDTHIHRKDTSPGPNLLFEKIKAQTRAASQIQNSSAAMQVQSLYCLHSQRATPSL